MTNRVYRSSQFVSEYPFIRYYVENPSLSNVRVANRTAGYRPEPEMIIQKKIVEREYPSMFQTSADIIVPRHLGYRKYREIIMQP